MPLLLVPAVVVGRVAGDPLEWAARWNALTFGATVALLFALARRRGLTGGQGAAVAAMTGGTLLFTYAATAYAESGVALTVAAILLGIDALGDRRGAALGIGAAAGFAVLLRADGLLLVVPLALAAVLWRRRDAWWLFAACAAPFVALAMAYNAARFGSWAQTSYAGETFSHTWASGAAGLLVSPGRGLLLFAPAVVACAVAWPAVIRRDAVAGAVGAGLLVARVAFYASWWAWDGGYGFGPRFLVPALPVLALAFIEIVRAGERRPLLLRATAVLAVLGFGQALVGVRDPSTWTNRAGASPLHPTTGDAQMFDWSAWPPVNMAESHRHRFG
jgi:hypothetical protein